MASRYTTYDADKLTAADFARIIPRQLYKYRSLNDDLFRILETQQLWFSNPAAFNDPFDCQLEISVGKTEDEIRANLQNSTGLLQLKGKKQQLQNRMLKDPAFYNDFMSKIHQLYINERLGVLCLTEKPDNMLMWAHYATSHTGICLGFSIKRGGFFYQNVLPVQYKQHYPRFNLSRYKKRARSLYTMHQQVVCTKSTLWEYEREWRVITDTGKGLYPFDKKELNKVIFGCRANAELTEKVKQTLMKEGYGHVKLYQAIPVEKRFGMRLKRI